jgi:MFS family permease
MDQLLIFRALQGLGTGLGIGLVAAVVGDLFPPEQRASKQGLLGIVFGVSQLCGPTLGGWITDHGPLLSGFVTETTRWRWLFYINLPIGLLALLVLTIFLPVQQSTERDGLAGRRSALRRVDWFGAGLLVTATCSLLLGLSLGSAEDRGWTRPIVVVLLAAAAVSYGLLLVVERKASEPILPLDVLRKPVFAIDALQTLIQGMILIGVFLPLTLFLQGVLMLSPTGTGTLITALSISLTLGAALAGVSISQRKRYQLTAIAGAALMTAGVLLLLLMGATGNLTLIGLALVMVGLGTGSFFTIQMVVAQNAIPLSQLGVGIGVIRYLSQLGMTLGSALMGLIVNGALTGNTAASLSTTSTARIQLSGILQHGFGLVLVLSIMILATTFFLKDVPHQQQAE